MGLFEFIGMKKKELTLEQVKREEIKLGIRETQTLAKLEKLEKEREDIFAKGLKIKSPPRRRQLARLYEMKSSGVKMMERELGVLSKELTTISALKLALERRQSSKDGVSRILERQRQVPAAQNVLQRLKEEDLMKLTTLLEDDKISEEVYSQKLDLLLGVVNDPAYESADIGNEGLEVLKTWEQMDEGELEFGEGLKEATGSDKEKAGGQKEAKEKEAEAGEAEPA